MQKILLYFFIFNISVALAAISETKVDVFFANGIDTDQESADNSARVIMKKFQNYNPTLYKSVSEWKTAYNHTHGLGVDLYESMLQKIYEDKPGSSLIPFIWNAGSLPTLLDFSFKGIVTKVAKKIPKAQIKDFAAKQAKKLAKNIVSYYNKKYAKKFTEEEIELMFNEIFDYLIEKAIDSYIDKTEEEIIQQELADLNSQLENYRTSIITGHSVVVIAHSQGNFFTNRAYQEFGAPANSYLDPWMKDYFYALGVATPANNILGENAPYITFDNDMIRLVPDSLPANVINPKHYFLHNALGESIETFYSPKAHSFLSSYMATDSTRAAILGYIQGAIIDHLSAPSQWQKSYEIGCGCDKRIGVEHKFDSSLDVQMQDADVLSFDETGKLYPIGFDYIKGDVGGDSVVHVNNNSICHELHDAAGGVIDFINSDTNVSDPHKGAIEVTLGWGNPDADFDLDVGMPFGKLDVQSCKTEHFYVESVSDIPAPPSGMIDKYPVTVTLGNLQALAGRLTGGTFPITIDLEVVTPGDTGVFRKFITDGGSGTYHIADIEISRDPDQPPKLVPTPETYATSNVAIQNSTGSDVFPDAFVYYHQCPSCPKYNLPSPPTSSAGGNSGGSSGGSGNINGSGSSGTASVTGVNFNGTVQHVNVVCTPPTLLDRNFSLIPGNTSGGNARNGGNTNDDGESGDCTGNDCGCLPCEYKVVELTQQAYLGPIPDAVVRLYNASDYGRPDAAVLYEGKTFDSNDISSAGAIDIGPENIPDDTDAFLVLEISGGRDIDFDDDFAVDAQPKPFNGILRMLVPKEVLKENAPFKANILTGIAFEVSRDLLGEAYDEQKLRLKLDDIAQKVLVDKIYRIDETPLQYRDLTYWLPADQSLLVKSYRQELLPIMRKLFDGANIQNDAYAFVYDPPQYFDVPVLQRTELTVDENAAAGSAAGAITVLAGTAGKIELNGDGSDLFTVNNEGVVFVAEGADIDYESTIGYVLQATAWNLDVTEAGTPVNVLIRVHDLPDAPLITAINFTAVFSENMVAGDTLAQLVVDPEIPVDSFSISGEDAAYFSVDDEGVIRIGDAEKLDFETKRSYAFTATAYNAFGRSLPRAFVLWIADDPTDMPQVVPVDANITEGSAPNTVVGRVQTIENGTPIVSLALGGSGSGDFTLEDDGTLSVSPSATIDWQTRNLYALSVSAIDGNGVVGNPAPVTIFVVKPEGVPELEATSIDVDTDTLAVGDVVGTVAIKTEGSAPIDRIVAHNTEENPFQVQNDGRIFYAGGAKPAEVYISWVNAVNVIGISYPQPVIVTTMTAFPVINDGGFSVAENSAPGTLLGTVGIISTRNVTKVELTGDGSENFRLENNGALYLSDTATLDYETKTSYVFSVRASNENGFGSPAQLRINVTNSRDIPVLGTTTANVPENTPAGTVVAQINVIDSGISPITSYRISDSNIFEIDRNGTVRVAPGAELDYEKRSEYRFSVWAMNSDGESLSAIVHIHITDVIEIPILQAVDVNVTENAAAGTMIGAVTVISEGASPITSFTLRGSDDFVINDLGEISVAENARIDFERQRSYQVTVSAHNSYGESNTVDVSIDVNNVPDTPPKAYASSMQIDENTLLGAAVGHLDVAEGEAAVNVIEIAGEGCGHFTADPDGTVRVAGELDYEERTNYNLTFSAASVIGKSNTATLDIGVNNVPETAPRLRSVSVRRHVHEFLVGQTFENLLIDTGDTPVRSIELRPDSPFGVRLDGALFLASAFSGQMNDFNLTAVAVNGFGKSDSVNVTVHVDAQPVLSATQLTVDENALAGTAVGKMGIVSEGMVPIDSFSIDSSLFTIDPNGSVRVAQGTELDFEKRTDYELNVIAGNRFGKSAPGPLHIFVNNIPEVAPTLHDMNRTVNRDTQVGTLLGNILDHQGDTPISEFVLAEESPFTVDLAGHIRLAESLVGAGTDTYRLSAQAKNAYGWSRPNTIDIRVLSPLVLRDTILYAYGTVPENTEVGRINMELNGVEIETIDLNGTGSEEFVIDTDGVIRVAPGVTLDPKRQKYYALQVTVNESYDAQVRIYVLERIVASIDTPGDAADVSLSSDGTKAYVADGRAGLQIVDIGDPAAPKIIGTVDTPHDAIGITLSSDGTKAFVADGESGLQIVDVSDPTAPNIVGSVDTPSYAFDVALSPDGTSAYVADDFSGVQIVDVNDPTVPTIIGHVDTPYYAEAVTLSSDGTIIYVADKSGLLIFDVSEPTLPYRIACLETPGSAYGIVLSPDGRKVYIADWDAGLQVVDVSIPTEPIVIGSVGTPGNTNGIALSLDGAKAYIADSFSGLQVIDVSDPTVPVVIGNIDTPYRAYRVALSPDNTKAYVADGHSGLQIIEVSGFEVPEKIIGFSAVLEADSAVGVLAGRIKSVGTESGAITSFKLTGEGAEDFAIDMNGDVTLQNELDYATRRLYNLKATATNATGDRSVDVTVRVHYVPELQDFTGEVNSMAKVGSCFGRINMWVDDSSTITDSILFGDGSDAFALDGDGEICVAVGAELHYFVTPEYNLTAIATNLYGSGNEAGVRIKVSPVIGAENTSTSAYDVILSPDETKAYIADDSAGLKIVDVTDPTVLRVIGNVRMPGTAVGVALSSDGLTAYVVDDKSGLQIVDITDPTAPYVIGSANTPGQAWGVAISSDGTKAYVADGRAGVQIISVGDSTMPMVIGNVDTPGFARSVTLSSDGTKAYVADGEAGLQIVDVSDPTLPTIVVSADTPGFAAAVTLSSDGSKAYVADGSKGFQIIDVSESTAPYIVRSVAIRDYAGDVILSPDGTNAYVADGDAGLLIIDISEPTASYIIGVVDVSGNIGGVTLSSDGSKAYVSDYLSGLKIIDLTGLK